jgi:hypothetical protein
MKTRGIILQGLDFGKDRMPSTSLYLRLSMVDPMVDSRSITEGKDVAGMAEQTPRIKLCLAGACVSPDWSEKPVEQLMLDALALR